MKKTMMTLICVGMIGLMATSGFAALSGTLTNPDFNDPDTGGADTFNDAINGWSEGGTGITTGGLLRTMDMTNITTQYSPNPYTSATQIVGLYWSGGTTTITGQNLYIFQSLGTVVSGDVGKVFTLSADFNAQPDWGNYSSQYNLEGIASFASGVTAGAAGSTGTVMGTASSTGAVLHTRTPQDVAVTWIDSGDASYTVQAGDVGTEIFAVLEVDVASFSEGNKAHLNAFIDSVVMIPEPATLIVLGLSGALMLLKRRRA